MTDTTPENPRLDRFKKAAMLLGGCHIGDKGQLAERGGWISQTAMIAGFDKSNLAKTLAGQRTLTPAMEGKMMVAIKRWRRNEIERHKQLILLQTDYDIDLRRGGILIEELDNELDGPAPSIGG